jgi:hypothetical protein
VPSSLIVKRLPKRARQSSIIGTGRVHQRIV